ncbi:MAG TPA: N-6 DNA methylase [Thermoanaerobaculia bacterium]|nr:N-6 DNA methylase [Thermoanaerobaculia bacterium]
MLTAASLRGYTGPAGVLDLLRTLGYPVDPIPCSPDEWRRGGVTIPWNGVSRLHLVTRLQGFDLFVLEEAEATEESISQFLRSYRKYNSVTKSVLVYSRTESFSIFDLTNDSSLRRLDVDLAHPSAAAVDRLNLLARGDDVPRIFDRALDREQVTREFFLRFRGAVTEVADALALADPEETREAADAEALLLLSRLLFLSFVQEKGWLNGERRFLVDRLQHEIGRGREFFAGVLLPLFFGCLNTPLEQRSLASRKLGRVPYLNGGLFEPSPYEQNHRELHLPNELMRRVLEDVFEKFDFRVDERDSASTHVDPEMLGKVFESLMNSDERAASGSFYTPREIVDVLTERAITTWLGDDVTEEKLARITIVDPACGSGAFLLSALGVLERAWSRIAPDTPRHELRRRIVAHSLYGVDLKPEAVRLCELRLWLAIVSVTDVPIDEVEPLPNLDRNIMQGNSLLGATDFLGDARADLYAEWVYALHAQSELLARYRSASHAQRPALARIIRGNDQRLAADLLTRSIDDAERELERESAPRRDLFGRAIPAEVEAIRALQQRIAEEKRTLERIEEGALDFFSFDVHFAPVIANGGFDVVVGNPPWVRNNRIESRMKRMLADRYRCFRERGDGSGFHQPDLSVAFFERALALASGEGVISLLMPAKMLNAAYAAPLRLAVREHVLAIDDWSDDPRRRRWFDADTFPLGVLAQKRRTTAKLQVTSCGEAFQLPRHALEGAEWELVPPDAAAILRRLRLAHRPLEAMLGRRPFMGVKTGDNRSFFLDVDEVRGCYLVTRERVRIPLAAVCRCVRGRDLQRWTTSDSHWMLWPPPDGWSKPPRWLKKLATIREMEPYEFRLSFVRPEHVGVKVAWKDLSRGVAAAVLPDVVSIGEQPVPLVPNQTLYAIDAVSISEAYVIAAVLNSTVAGALLVAVAERAKDAHYRYFGRTVAGLPYPDTESQFDRLERLSRRAHRGADVSDELDDVVARLYGVSAGELQTLRAFLERRLRAGGSSD